jgi:hypothetical protein
MAGPGVVHDEVHDDPDAAAMRFGQEPVEVGIGTVVRIDPLVVDRVVAVVAGGREYGHEPERIHGEVLAGRGPSFK